MTLDLYDKVEQLVAQYQGKSITKWKLDEKIAELWQELQYSDDPSNKLLFKVLDKTLALVEGAIYPNHYEKAIGELRRDWLEQ